MIETTELTGSLLGAEVWQRLADEYLLGARSNVPGVEALGDYVDSQVERWVVGGDAPHVEYWCSGTFWDPVPGQPYDGLDDLSADVLAGSALVSTDYCDHPVWSQDTNVRFRIWHDTAHVRHGLGFGVDDEVRLWVHQAREIDRLLPVGAGAGRVIDALFCESIYQLAAFIAGGGRYPDEQYVVAAGPVGKQVQHLLFALVR
jgi:hypothetical protein